MTVTAPAKPRTLHEAATEFLACKRIAVAGVSRDANQPANLIYRRLRDAGHEVYAVNPNTTEAEGDPCFASVAAVPAQLDGVVVVTPPDAAGTVVDDCVRAAVPRVWFHRGMGHGSADASAIAKAREGGLAVIPGGCPCMFGETSDPGHRVMRGMLLTFGRIPRRV